MSFRFYWTDEGVLAKRASAKRALLSKCAPPQPVQDIVLESNHNVDTLLMDSLPQIMADLDEVRQACPELFDEVRELKQATRSLLAALSLNDVNGESPCASPSPIPSAVPSPTPDARILSPSPTPSSITALPVEAPVQKKGEEPSQPGSRQPTPRPEADTDFQFVVPGMITEEPSGGTDDLDPVIAAPPGGPG